MWQPFVKNLTIEKHLIWKNAYFPKQSRENHAHFINSNAFEDRKLNRHASKTIE
jgi:hypothetical protein